MKKRNWYYSLGLSSFFCFTLISSASALEELNLDELKKQYPACKDGETWNYCYGEKINSNNEARQTRIGMFKGGLLWTGNIYEFGKLEGVCVENKCERLPQCEFSIFRQQYECRNGDKFWGFSNNSEDKLEGKGTYVWSNGTKHEGEMKDNLFDGQGKREFPNGSVYTGAFKNDLMHGFGIYKFEDGSVYKGEFKEGMYSGQGEFTYAEGDRYVGEFLNDQFNGYGVFYYSDGTKKAGRWVNGEYVGQ